ncbi:MAG: hypothetical protein CVU56_27865, partial [Deltaproteobacteria bacterium HGW-Deltaproteobacteria-14]
MPSSKLIAPAAMALAAVGLAVILVQSASIGALEDRVASQEAALAKLAGARSPANKPAAARAPTPDLGGIEARLAAAEREAKSASVLARAAAARGGAAVAGEADDGAIVSLADDIASLRTDVDALLTGRGLETPEAKVAMRAVVDEAREQAQTARRTRMEERRRAWIDGFAAEQHLSDAQAEALQEALDAQREARDAMRDAARDGDKSWEEAREDMRAARQAFDKRLDEILDADQRAAYDASQGGRGGRGGRGGVG